MLAFSSRLILQRSSSILNKSTSFTLGLNNYCTRYTESHEWVNINGNQGRIGLTNHAQKTLGDIVFIETPEVDRSFKANDPIGVVESVKAASDIFTPLSIKVTRVNSDLESEPELVNEDPYENWIVQFETNDLDTFKKLMTKEEYEKFANDKE